MLQFAGYTPNTIRAYKGQAKGAKGLAEHIGRDDGVDLSVSVCDESTIVSPPNMVLENSDTAGFAAATTCRASVAETGTGVGAGAARASEMRHDESGVITVGMTVSRRRGGGGAGRG